MAEILNMPASLAGADEAVLSKWIVNEGATFNEGDAIAEVETEKAIIEVPAESAGVMAKHLIAPGKSVLIGKPIAILAASGEDLAAAIAQIGVEDTPGESQLTSSNRQDVAAANMTAESSQSTTPLVTGQTSQDMSGRLMISPIARKLARENGLSLSALIGSGPNGRIVKNDVLKAAAGIGKNNPSPASVVSQVSLGGPIGASGEVIAHSPMRKAIARRLSESKSSVPHFYLKASANVDALLTMRAKINEWREDKISVTDLLLRTIAAAYQDVPDANVIWGADALTKFSHVDVALAVATAKGLVTPVIRGIDKNTLSATVNQSRELIEKARAGQLKQNEIEGGSMSLTNLGMYGTDEFYAIINPPQSMILAVGAAKKSAVVINDQIQIASVINFTLSVDHRAIDGALAAQWLAAFCKRIENPMWLIN
jgi:pyruvate dehydrogenase E2 component (dihydrolipoamide acetyltransferase)